MKETKLACSVRRRELRVKSNTHPWSRFACPTATLLLGGLTVLAACRNAADPVSNSAVRYDFESIHMAVPWRIVVYDLGGRDAASVRGHAEAAFREVARLERIMSDWDEDSELSRLGAASEAGASTIDLSRDLAEVLSTARELASASDGAFDPSIGPLTKLWRKARRLGALPTAEEIAAARARVGWQHFDVDRAALRLRFTGPAQRFDLGGIAKGHALDAALRVLRSRGLPHALVEAGGDISCGAAPPGKSGWRIAQDHEDGADASDLIVTHCGVATSGSRFQHIDVAGARYSHILDPRRGFGLPDAAPTPSGARSAAAQITIVATNACLADGLATACSVLDDRAAEALLRRYGARRARAPASKTSLTKQ